MAATILYITTDGRSAERLASVLYNFTPPLTISWTGEESAAVPWLRENQRAAVVIVNATLQSQSWNSLVGQVRSAGLTVPIIVVGSELVGPMTALKAGADYFVADHSLLSDLPEFVGRAVRRAQEREALETQVVSARADNQTAQSERAAAIQQWEQAREQLRVSASMDTTTKERLEQEVRKAEASANENAQRWNSALELLRRAKADFQATLDQERAHRERDLAAALDEASTARRAIEQQLAQAKTSLLHAERRANIQQLAAAQASQRQSELEGQLAQELANRDAFAHRLGIAEAALKDAEQRRDAETTAAAAHSAQRQALADAELTQAIDDRNSFAQQLRDIESALTQARRDAAAAADAAVRLRAREAELTSSLAEAAGNQRTLEFQLGEAKAALEQADARATAQQRAAEEASQRHLKFEERLAQDAAGASALAEKLLQAEAALQDFTQKYNTEMEADAARLAELQADHAAELAKTTAARDTLSQQLRDAEGAHARAFHRAAALAQRHTEVEAQLAQEIANTDALAQSLVEARKTLETAERRHAAELQTSAQQRAEYQARHETQLAERVAAHDALAQQLRTVEGALAQSHQEAERLTHRETELAASLAEAAGSRRTLESQLKDLQIELGQTEQRHLELEARLAQEVANRDALGRSLVEAQNTLETAERRHAAELQASAQQRAEYRTQYEAQLAVSAAAHDALAQQLRTVEGALEQSHQEAERLTHRETELAASLAEAAINKQTLESRLGDLQSALEQAGQRHVELDARLAQEIANRDMLAQQLREAQDALTRAQQDAAAAAAAAAARLTQRESAYTAQLAQQGAERKTLESKLADTRSEAEQTLQRILDEVRQLQLERDTTQQSLSTRQQEVQRLNHANDEARENLERARKVGEGRVHQLTAEHAEAQRALMQARADLEKRLEHAANERASERVRLDREITQLQGALLARGRELETTKSDLETVRIEASRVPQLQSQLDTSRAELLSTFIQAPYSVCRCARDGTLKDVNGALATLLGYRTPDELRKVDFAKVFESPDDLRLLIESCLTGGERQPVETTWATRARDRIIVRLIARPVGAESIEIVAEEVTNLRVVEAQLRQAQRMEAVGRLAVEVAGTCDNLLRDVSHDALQWLATVDPNSAFRHRGELLLQEVNRAANFLRQLSAYSTKQATPLEPSDVNRVLRQMEPVLKRIAGDHIELVLPKSSSPVKVDVEAEHVERVLVNAASYGRERMRSGGRMMFEFATVEVGREFAAQHPNVRSGSHVLMTIKEVRGAAPSPASTEPPAELTEAKTPYSAPDIRPGVDLGVLQGLISDCGGHLWMKAEPTGEMVMKVRLPQHDRSSRSLLGPRRGGSFDWLRH